MKKNVQKRLVFSVGTLALCAVIFGCATIKQPEHVYSRPDYTESDVRKMEITRIDDILKKNSVEALWRACLLGDTDEKSKCMSSVVSEYEASLSKKDYFTSLRLYRSLKATGYENIAKLEKSGEELQALCDNDVPGLSSSADTVSLQNDDSKKTPKKVSEYVKGTVTVWVDRGIKIEKGIGYSDIVIGSGFFIDKNGYIVTNNHVIADLVDPKYEGYVRLYIKLADDPDTRIPAKVVGWDPLLDLALLKTEVDAPYVFKLGSSKGLEVGDKIYAIGSPVGLGRTLTSGVVSAMGRKLFTTGSVMQIDAAVNSGNSGGPCIDVDGNVQAIVFAGMLQYEGLNFAIPVEYLKADLPMLYHGGECKHPWVASYGHTKKDGTAETGVEVQYVMPGGSASRADLSAGDVITSIDDRKVRKIEELQDVLRNYTTDTIVSCSYEDKDGKTLQCLLYLSERPKNPGYEIYQHDVIAGSFVPILGMKLVSVSMSSNTKYSISDIIKGSIADESGFSVNDPVDVLKVKFNDDNSALYTELSMKRQKKGYLDANIALSTQLDSPYYF